MGIAYESVGRAEITIGSTENGVSIVANRDGLRSLARLFTDLAETDADHIHLTPTMQLTEASEALVVAIR